jgi:hypothetical protein
MTEGQLWQIMLKLKIFTPAMILKEANPPQYLKQHLKGKIKSLIMSQLKHGILVKYNDNPAVFGLPGQDINVIKRSCVVCRKKFIPKRDNNQYCSKECESKHAEDYLKGRYTEEEEELILNTISKHGMTPAILQELSEKLERPVSSIKAKIKYMKKTGVVR